MKFQKHKTITCSWFTTDKNGKTVGSIVWNDMRPNEYLWYYSPEDISDVLLKKKQDIASSLSEAKRKIKEAAKEVTLQVKK